MEIINESGVGYTTQESNQNIFPNIENMKKGIEMFAKPTGETWAKQNPELVEKAIKEKNDKILEEKEKARITSPEYLAEKEQKELWEREDKIRKETQAREDTAYRRAVEDMKKAGVNPNLQNISGAQSGGGISSASEKNLSRIENDKDRQLKLLLQKIEQEWKGSQKDKDRLINTLTMLFKEGNDMATSIFEIFG